MSKNIENIALVSAAGAGKTRALTRRFLFLYLQEANFSLNSLYGITFTNEAAFEMKSRILRYLDLLATNIAKDESEKGILEEFSEIFPDIKERAKNKKIYLLNNLSDLNISTFHSLFSHFLSSIPFAAGILPGYQIIDETEEKIIFESVLDKFFENVFQEENVFSSINDLMEQEETKPKERIEKIYQNIVPWLNFIEGLIADEKNIKIRSTEFKDRFSELLKEFKDFVYENAPAGYTKKGDKMDTNLVNFLDKIGEYIQTKELKKLIDSDSTESILYCNITNKKYIQKFLNNLGEKSTVFSKILKRLEICTREYLNSLSDHQILIHLKPILEIHQKFKKEKQDKNLLSFNDIENYTLQALKNNLETDYLYFKIGNEVRHLLIDEFQDTSYRQLEILEPLISEIISVSPLEKSLFYVGDPHQAIFRFRGGTPELFGLLKEKYKDKINSEELNINYRSKEEIINFVNKILDKNNKARENNTGGWIRVENLGSFANKEDDREKIVMRTFKIVKELYNNYGYEYSDIAVLVRKNDFAVEIAEELAKRNIPCVSKSRADILNDNDVRFILNLLRFLDNPEDDFSLMHVLISPVFGIEEETLRYLKSKGKTLFLTLSDDHSEWFATQKLKKLLSIVGFCNPYELIYQIYKELQIRISYSLATLLDVALDYTKNGFSHLSSFINWIEVAGEAIEIKEVHPEGVNILTVHKAKGLEFEVVIIPETDYSLKPENTQLLFSYTEDGTKPEKIYWRKYGKYFQELIDAEKRRLINDELNLLYVAMTRAKNGLYILGYSDKNDKSGFWFETISEKLGSKSYSIGEIIKKEKTKIKEKEEKPYGIISQGTIDIEGGRLLYSPTERGVEIIEPERRKGMEFGRIIHQALSRIEWLDDADTEKTIYEIVDYIKDIYVRVPEDEMEIEKNLKPLLFETLTDPDLRFIFFKDKRNVKCGNELPVYFAEEKRDITAHIDRVIMEENKVIIVDYKTGEEKPEYKHQMKVYKKGIQTIYPGIEVEIILIYLERERGKKLEIC